MEETIQRQNRYIASLRDEDRRNAEWIARLERLIVDDLYGPQDELAHAREYRLVADMIRAGR